MTVLQQAHLYVDQLRREANKTRINVSEAIQDMMVTPTYPAESLINHIRSLIGGIIVKPCPQTLSP